MRLLTILRQLRQKFSRYQPLVEILIHRDNILHNLRTLRERGAGWQIAPVLKSNAYGHGLLEVAKIVDHKNIPFIVVDSPFEAIILRREGIKSKILVIGYTTVRNICKFNHKNISFTITSLDQLQELNNQLTNAKDIHLKIDTGMHRQGISLTEIDTAIGLIRTNSNLNLEGVCSHLADPTNQPNFTNQQITSWHQAMEKFLLAFPNIKFRHLAATGGLPYREQIQANVARVGLGLYGINSAKSFDLGLLPALELITHVSAVKTVPTGEYVGYNLAFQAKRNTLIANLPIGYAEGVDLRLSNQGVITIKNTPCQIVGRVSMNITAIDITGLPTVKRDDLAKFISLSPHDQNSVENIARQCNTIPYEILIHLPQHLRRRVV